MRQPRLIVTLIFVFVMLNSVTRGQTFSYLYIQGDKETPIYVKLEDEMQPRYGKNYCIISQLAPGPVHIQILFQQNIYPTQNFTIDVPENGYRGFLLTHKADSFTLYDLQQKRYFSPTNKSDNNLTFLAENKPGKAVAPQNENELDNHANSAADRVNKPETEVALNKNAMINSVDPSGAVVSTSRKMSSTTVTDTILTDSFVVDKAIGHTQDKAQPQFIDNVVLDNERTLQPASTLDVPRQPTAQPEIINGDCQKPVDNSVFEDIYMNMMQKSGDARLKYLLKNSKHCFSCNQVQTLAKNLLSDPQRYSFMKQVYPRITDQPNFMSLESLYATAEWKSYFRLIAQ